MLNKVNEKKKSIRIIIISAGKTTRIQCKLSNN